jgi:hypothetical protein
VDKAKVLTEAEFWASRNLDLHNEATRVDRQKIGQSNTEKLNGEDAMFADDAFKLKASSQLKHVGVLVDPAVDLTAAELQPYVRGGELDDRAGVSPVLAEKRQALIQQINFHSRLIVSATNTTATIAESTGTSSKIDRMLRAISRCCVTQLCPLLCGMQNTRTDHIPGM